VFDKGGNFSDSGGVGNKAGCARDTSEVAIRDNGGRLVVDSALEAGTVGHQSTNRVVATAALTSLGTTSPRMKRQHAT
jgi:hypothetical protein